jgi:hypothetical protein
MRKTSTSNAKQQKTSAIQQASELQQADRAERTAKLDALVCELTGIKSPEVVHQILWQMERMHVLGDVWGAEVPISQEITLALHMLAELRPAGVMEALLVVQMVGVQEAMVAFLKRSTDRDQNEKGCDADVLRSTRLGRLFIEQLEVLLKLKGRATQQKVTVEHVHVHAGAQAVVGVVKGPKGEGERG